MNRPLDILFINADSSAAAYQALAKDFAAIEPPTWSLLLAQSCRSKGWGVEILDA
ncbi:MAG: B12-binding domain-containing radical SAM protein, partial [Proteobacteria bacterium]|nr:B12-binding domain-containing radical SAM protein [Pseudomonadota bacterium]